MKRIISVILIVACLGMLFSCNLFGFSTKNFEEAMANTNPSKVTITTSTTTAGLGTIHGNYVVTYNEDNTATIKYDGERWAGIPTDGSEIGDETKVSFSGTVTRDANGVYSDPAFVEDVELALSLNVGEIKDSTISVDGKTLTATVAKADTATVFGVAYNFDVVLTIVRGENAIERITLAYTTGANEVSIKCEYD
jgi:hypothetical protein